MKALKPLFQSFLIDLLTKQIKSRHGPKNSLKIENLADIIPDKKFRKEIEEYLKNKIPKI